MHTMAAEVETGNSQSTVFVQFPLTQIFNESRSRTTTASRISLAGVVVDAMVDDGEHPYRWLDFCIPGTNREIRALAQFQGTDERSGETFLSFKHLWPEARLQLDRFLAANQVQVAA